MGARPADGRVAAGAPGAAVGIVLAAGAGRRYGRPKGLVLGEDGRPWVAARAQALLDGGCAEVLVVVGAAGDDVAALVPRVAVVVRAEGWARGLSASLTAGLAAAEGREPPVHGSASGTGQDCWSAAVVAPVDVPDLSAAEVARVLTTWPGHGLARATHAGRPGHPVVLDRPSWAAAAVGGRDEGARRLLAGPGVLHVECGDLGTGLDVDAPDAVGPAAPGRR